MNFPCEIGHFRTRLCPKLCLASTGVSNLKQNMQNHLSHLVDSCRIFNHDCGDRSSAFWQRSYLGFACWALPEVPENGDARIAKRIQKRRFDGKIWTYIDTYSKMWKGLQLDAIGRSTDVFWGASFHFLNAPASRSTCASSARWNWLKLLNTSRKQPLKMLKKWQKTQDI